MDPHRHLRAIAISLGWSLVCALLGAATGQAVLATALQILGAALFFKRTPRWSVLIMLCIGHSFLGTVVFVSARSYAVPAVLPVFSAKAFTFLAFLLLSLFAASTAIALLRPMSTARASRCRVGRACANCGYRIDNLPSVRCPECGTPVGSAAPSEDAPARQTAVMLIVAMTTGVAAATLAGQIPGFYSFGFDSYFVDHVLFESSAERSDLTYRLLDLLETKMMNGGQVTQRDVSGIIGSPDAIGGSAPWTVWYYEASLTQFHRRKVCLEVVFRDGFLSAVYII